MAIQDRWAAFVCLFLFASLGPQVGAQTVGAFELDLEAVQAKITQKFGSAEWFEGSCFDGTRKLKLLVSSKGKREGQAIIDFLESSKNELLSVPGSGRGLSDQVELVPIGPFLADSSPSATRSSRPAVVGAAVQHPKLSGYGTLGARVKDRAGQPYALSNAHVLAPKDKASRGDEILQPPAIGTRTEDCTAKVEATYYKPRTIANLSDSKNINYRRGLREVDRFNRIDAAIAETAEECVEVKTPDGCAPRADFWPLADIEQTVVDKHTPIPVTAWSRIDERRNFGELICVKARVRVRVNKRKAWFGDQLVIRGVEGRRFHEEGDSGSLVIVGKPGDKCPDYGRPVGLLFALSQGGYSLANPIENVLCCLQVGIDNGVDKPSIPDAKDCDCNP